MNGNNLARARYYLAFWQLTGLPDYLSGAAAFFADYRRAGGLGGEEVAEALTVAFSC